MKYLILTALFLVSLGLFVGCKEHAPLEISRSNNGWEVQTCFEYVVNDRKYSIHRFSNGVSEWRYFVVPEGEVIDVFTRSDGDDGTVSVPVNNIPTVKGK